MNQTPLKHLHRTQRHRARHGYALISGLLAVVLLMAMLTTYFAITNSQLQTTRNTTDGATAFFAAEGGLNLRAEKVKAKFVDYNRPTGTSPTVANACATGNRGTGDFECDDTIKLGGKQVVTYVVEPNPAGENGTINDPTDPFNQLNYIQYTYEVNSEARNANTGAREATLQMKFQSRLVPLFQFAAFYNKNLEILPGADMTLNGRVHSNANLYLNTESGNTLTINGRVTVGEGLWRGRLNNTSCNGTVRVSNGAASTAAISGCGSTFKVSQPTIQTHNGWIQDSFTKLTVPSVTSLDPLPANDLWSKADLRIGLINQGGAWNIVARDVNKSIDSTMTARLNACAGSLSSKALGTTNTFYNHREQETIRMLEVDVGALLTCFKNNPTLFLNGAGEPLWKDTSNGGVAIHFSFDDANPTTAEDEYVQGGARSNPARYETKMAVRLRNGSDLSMLEKGFTVATNQPVYVMGNYNSAANWRPAAIMADSINLLSPNWPTPDHAQNIGLNGRQASALTVNAAFLAGTDTTVAGGQYNGGLENYPRFHEDWSGAGRPVTYRGSFVSLSEPAHVNGNWGGANVYNAPRRNWDYEQRFNNAANLPPLTPRFVYLRQLLFARDY